MPHHAHRAADGHRNGSGLLGRGSRRAARAHGRSCRAHRPSGGARELSAHRRDRRRGREEWRGRSPPGLWIPGGERRIRGRVFRGVHLRRPVSGRDSRNGIEDRSEAHRSGGGRAGGAGLSRRAGSGEARGRGGGDRLSAVDQGFGRRRRERHARGELDARVRERAGGRATRVESRVRRRRRVVGKVPVRTEAHRSADSGGCARPHAVSVRARLFRAATTPESDRRSARADVERRPTSEYGGGGGKSGRGDRLRRRRHDRVHHRSGRVLLHGDEHAVAGGASGDRGDPRPRSRRMAVAHRVRRAADVRSVGSRDSRSCGRGARLRGESAQEIPAVHRRVAARQISRTAFASTPVW